MNDALFRQEAREARLDDARLGPVSTARSPGAVAFTLLVVAAACSLLGYASWGQYTRKAHVTGYLVPDRGLIKVYPPQTGILADKRVVEGQSVRAGDTLYVLTTEHASEDTATAEQSAIDKLAMRRESLESEFAKQVGIDRIEHRAVLEKLRGMESELAQLSVERALQQRRVDSARVTVDRYRKLVDSRFVSPAQLQQKDDELLEQQAKLQALERTRLALERDSGQLRLDLDAFALKADNGRAAIRREIATLEQTLTEHRSRRTVFVTAPADGTVSAVLAERGQLANPQQPLLSLLPAGAALEAQLLVPSRSIGFVEPNQSVALRYQAFPYQRFGSQPGHVTAISKTLIAPGDAVLPVALQESVYRVTVALDAQTIRAYAREVPLVPGMLLEADIRVDRRRIVEWIFDPLFSVARRI